MRAGQQLRALLNSPHTEHILEAHSAISAQIVEEAGIPGIWASSLTLSALNGLRDNSEITMTESVAILESITTAVDIPILFDGDTGYGQFSHFQQLVKKLVARGVGGVCIEDKLFPKKNSFIAGESQQLATIDEFCGKLRAGKDAQRDDDFVIAARTEAYITGLGTEEALERAEAYVDAGADAILVHSKEKTFAQVQDFMRHWKRDVPVICVPTTYYHTPREAFDQAGVALIIWANHMLRVSVQAMQGLANHIGHTGSARDLEENIASVKELFRLQDTKGLDEAEAVYGEKSSSQKAIVLAASRGSGLDALTEDRPKCMIPIQGQPAIEKLVQHLRAEGIRDISIVRGYRPEALTPEGATYYENPRWDETNELGSLAVAAEALKGDVVLAFGDLVFKRYILHELMSSDADITLVVDSSCDFVRDGRRVDRVRASAPAPKIYDENRFALERVDAGLPDGESHGEWIGLARMTPAGTDLVRQGLEALMAEPDGDLLEIAALWNHLLERHGAEIRVLYVQGDWIDINTMRDVADSNA